MEENTNTNIIIQKTHVARRVDVRYGLNNKHASSKISAAKQPTQRRNLVTKLSCQSVTDNVTISLIKIWNMLVCN